MKILQVQFFAVFIFNDFNHRNQFFAKNIIIYRFKSLIAKKYQDRVYFTTSSVISVKLNFRKKHTLKKFFISFSILIRVILKWLIDLNPEKMYSAIVHVNLLHYKNQEMQPRVRVYSIYRRIRHTIIFNSRNF